MNTLIWLFLICAGFALVYWGITRLTLPPNVQTVIIVLMGLIALAFVANLFMGGNPAMGLHLR